MQAFSTRPYHAQRVMFKYKSKWYMGYYSACRDWFYRCKPNHIRFRDVEEWKATED